jgi:triosephosphate isomerase (TIM)
LDKIEIVICPPYTSLDEINHERGQFVLGAQNLHWEDQGTDTGEVSGGMLQEAGCQYVLVGHSERRWKMGETDAMIHQKLAAAWRHQLKPVLCIGEQAADRQANKTERVLSEQLKIALEGFSKSQIAALLVAYEPVWAIGTGKIGSVVPATAEEVRSAYAIIKQCLGQIGLSVPLLYGGSVDAKNIIQFFLLPENRGFFVGGASLDPKEFGSIIKQTVKYYGRS